MKRPLKPAKPQPKLKPTKTIMSDQTQLAVRPRASQQLAALMGMEPTAMLDVIKAQCFRGNSGNISDAQLAAFVSIAADMGVNPLLPGMLYAFPIQGGGIIPMMGPDGVYKKLSEHPDVDSWDTTVYPEDVSVPPTHATTRIYRKGRERPLSYTALLSEWKVGSNGNWNSRARHMLGLRSLKQCARQIIHGVPYDEDERKIIEELNVTPEPEKPDRPAPPAREKKGAATVAENPKKGQTIEAEIVEAPARDKTVAEIAEVSAPVAAETKAPRAFLKPNEEIEAVCTVAAVTPTMLDLDRVNAPSVQVKLTGEYVGDALHHKGGTGDASAVAPLPVWVVGATVRCKLFGRQFKGGVRTMVLSVEAVAQQGAMVLE